MVDDDRSAPYAPVQVGGPAHPESASLPPTVLQIGPVRYTVSTDAVAHLEAQAHESKHLIGWADHQALRILISPAVAPDLARETMLHETLHAVWTLTGLDDDDEERTISALSPWLMQVLRSNPELVAYLVGGSA